MKSTLSTLRIFAAAFAWLSVAYADFPPEWDRQEAQDHGWIYDDWEAGLAKSGETGKPMLVVLRCPP